MTNIQRIRNTPALRQAIAGGQHEFRLLLNGGAFSRKTIALRPDGRFRIENHIDGSVQNLTGRQLYTESNIGEGMRFGALVAE